MIFRQGKNWYDAVRCGGVRFRQARHGATWHGFILLESFVDFRVWCSKIGKCKVGFGKVKQGMAGHGFIFRNHLLISWRGEAGSGLIGLGDAGRGWVLIGLVA